VNNSNSTNTVNRPHLIIHKFPVDMSYENLKITTTRSETKLVTTHTNTHTYISQTYWRSSKLHEKMQQI